MFIGLSISMSTCREIFFNAFDTNLVLRYMERQEAKRAQKTAAGFKAMDWVKYSMYFMNLGAYFVLLGDGE